MGRIFGRKWLFAVPMLIASGCGGDIDASRSDEKMMVDDKHEHYHVHGKEISHDHTHTDATSQGHAHDHQHTDTDAENPTE